MDEEAEGQLDEEQQMNEQQIDEEEEEELQKVQQGMEEEGWGEKRRLVKISERLRETT